MEPDAEKALSGIYVVVSEKMDGECTTIYDNGVFHARSVDSKPKPYQDHVRAHASRLRGELSAIGIHRVVGENLRAKHSIAYTLPYTHTFQVFAMFDYKGICISHEDTCEYAALLDLVMVPELYSGLYDEAKVKACMGRPTYSKEQEGYVLRHASSFHESAYMGCVAKYVRPNHVQTTEHWSKHWEYNKIREYK